MNRRLVLLAVAGAALAGAACDDKQAVLSNPVAADAFGFQLNPSATNLPRGSVRFRTTAPESVVVTLTGLDSLSAGSYTFWLGSAEGTDFTRVAGEITVVRADTTFDADGNPLATPVSLNVGTRSSMTNGGTNQTFTVAITPASAGVAALNPRDILLVTIEESEAATTPHADNRPLWARRGTAAIANVGLAFGNFAPEPLDEFRFVGTSRGRASIMGPVLMVNDSSMPRPPKGYYYAAFAVKPTSADGPGDTLYIGRQTSPWPRRHLSQYNADLEITDPEVVTDRPWAIIAGSAHISADTVPRLPSTFPYRGFTEVRVVLQPKLGIEGRMGTARMLGGPVPGVVTGGVR